MEGSVRGSSALRRANAALLVGFCYVSQAVFKPTAILLPWSSERWDYKHVPMHLAGTEF